jgi:hypothetical protein
VASDPYSQIPGRPAATPTHFPTLSPGVHGVASAVPYAIVEVGGRLNYVAADLLGEVSFVIEVDGEACHIDGNGTRDGGEVVFYQKDNDHEGRDVRVWQIRDSLVGCTAEHVAAM